MKNIVSFMIALICWGPSFCQTSNDHRDFLEVRKRLVYENHAGLYVAHILTGKNYRLRYPGAKNSQFFKSKHPENGMLVYDGVIFENIEIQYDLFSQKIVILLDSKNYAKYVSIDSERVSAFSIKGHDFKHIKQDSIMKDGFYQVAFEGQSSGLFIKRRKDKSELFNDGKHTIEFTPVTRYFVKNPHGTFRISSKKSFLKAYGTPKNLIEIIKKNKLKFSKKKIEDSLITAVSMSDQKSTID